MSFKDKLPLLVTLTNQISINH